MDKKFVWAHLDNRLATKVVDIGCCNDMSEKEVVEYVRETSYDLRCWVVGEVLCELTTYSDELDDKWYKKFVQFIQGVLKKDSALDQEDFMLCYHLFVGDGWRFNYGSSIYGCWVDWERTYKPMEWGKNLNNESLEWCLEWINAR